MNPPPATTYTPLPIAHVKQQSYVVASDCSVTSSDRRNHVNSLECVDFLFLGEAPSGSAPSLTLSRALEHHGNYRTAFSNGLEWQSTRDWLKLARRARAIIVVAYDGPPAYVVRQLALAATFGVPVFRWWVGSDVLNALTISANAGLAQQLCSFTALNIAVAEQLATELRSLGIVAKVIPSVLYPPPQVEESAALSTEALPKRLLVYLPSERIDFYCGDLVREAAKCNPDIEFIIVADEEHSLAALPNVRSLGWIDGLEDAWNEAGGLLRITQHDGMPRMVLEALFRKKYVIYSWPLKGCILAKNIEDINRAINWFGSQTKVNTDGPARAKDIFTPDPTGMFVSSIAQAHKIKPITRRMKAFGTAAALTLAMRVARYGRHMLKGTR